MGVISDNGAFIIDCPNMCWRLFFATRSRKLPLHFLFCNQLLKLQEQLGHKSFVFCWDLGVSFRKEVYPEYKANRPKLEEDALEWKEQMVVLRKEILPEIGFRNNFAKKGFEADDLIALVVQKLSTYGNKLVIVSSDKDLHQCLCQSDTAHEMNPVQYDPIRRQTTTAREVAPDGVNVWLQTKAIIGCKTDNIKGIKGIGERNAKMLGKGTLSKKGKLYKKYKKNIGIVKRNLEIVVLPYKWAEIKIRSDITTYHTWKTVMKRLGNTRLALRNPFMEEPMP